MSYIVAFLLFFTFQFVLSGIAIMMDKNRPWKLILYAPFSIFGYKQLNNFVVVKSILDTTIRKNRLIW
jgi:hypothetical protein